MLPLDVVYEVLENLCKHSMLVRCDGCFERTWQKIVALLKKQEWCESGHLEERDITRCGSDGGQ